MCQKINRISTHKPSLSQCNGICQAFVNRYLAQKPDIYRCICSNSDKLVFVQRCRFFWGQCIGHGLKQSERWLRISGGRGGLGTKLTLGHPHPPPPSAACQRGFFSHPSWVQGVEIDFISTDSVRSQADLTLTYSTKRLLKFLFIIFQPLTSSFEVFV